MLNRSSLSRTGAVVVALLCAPGSAQAQATAQTAIRYRVVRSIATNDTLNARVVDRNAVVYSTTESRAFGPGGTYQVRWESDAFGLKSGQFLRLGSPAEVQAALDEALHNRRTAETTITDESVRSLPNFPVGTANRKLIAAAVPFEVFGPDNHRAELVMFQRHTSGNVVDSVIRNSRLLGTQADTLRVQVPANMWLPGDTLYVVEGSGEQRRVTMSLTLACAAAGEPQRTTCNPLALGTKGATGYLPLADGYVSVWHLPGESGR